MITFRQFSEKKKLTQKDLRVTDYLPGATEDENDNAKKRKRQDEENKPNLDEFIDFDTLRKNAKKQNKKGKENPFNIKNGGDKSKKSKLPPHLAKLVGPDGNFTKEVEDRLRKAKKKGNWKVTPKGFGPKS